MHARMDAVVPVDAQNAPTGPWKTAQSAVSHSAHTHPLSNELYIQKSGHSPGVFWPDSPPSRQILPSRYNDKQKKDLCALRASVSPCLKLGPYPPSPPFPCPPSPPDYNIV